MRDTAGQLSVVIASHNRGRRLSDVVGAIGPSEPVAEIIVVDDGSTDETPEILEAMSREEPRLRVIRLERNEGPTRARRKGVMASRSDVVLCIDDDVILAIGAAGQHQSHHLTSEAEVVVGYMPLAVHTGSTAVANRYGRLYEERVALWRERPELILSTLWGGFVSFRRASLLEADALCEPSLRYSEDLELGHMLAELGCSACFDPSIRAEHRHVRTVRATFAENLRAGAALAWLERRHPERVSAAHIFEREGASAVRSRLLRMVARPRPQRLLSVAVSGAEALPGLPRLAARMLDLGCRANYYCGYRSGGQSSSG